MVYSIRMKIRPISLVNGIRMKIKPKSIVLGDRMNPYSIVVGLKLGENTWTKIRPKSTVYSTMVKIRQKIHCL